MIRITKDRKSTTIMTLHDLLFHNKRRREKTFPHGFRPGQTQTWVYIATGDG